jgi:hypothetical protein
VKVVNVEQGEGWVLYNGDCVEVSRGLPSNSVGLSCFSPPFSSLYTYSPSVRDMGNSDGDEEFFDHFEYLLPELLRITKPGRLACVHTKDLPRYKGSHRRIGPPRLHRRGDARVRGRPRRRWIALGLSLEGDDLEMPRHRDAAH